MALDTADQEAIAERLHNAHRCVEGCEPPSATHDLEMTDAYDVQDAFVERRRETADTDRIGFKVGFTNEAVRDQQGVDEPIYGQILADRVTRDPVVQASRHGSPRFEPELAFRLSERLEPPLGPGAVTAATAAVFPTIEVVTSRIDTPAEVVDHVADNGLHSGVVVGEACADPCRLAGGDLSMVPVQVRVNGAFHEAGLGANAMGNPARAVAWLAERRAERGEPLQAGDTVLTGSLTRIVDIEPGDTLTCQWGDLGSVRIRLE